MTTEIRTCSNSLLAPGLCCIGTCKKPPTRAVLLDDFTEHTWCDEHAQGHANVTATKPLIWDPIWRPS